MDFNKWAQDIYQVAYDSIRHCLENSRTGKWKEDFITAEILERLNKLPAYSLRQETGYKNVNLESFKFSGTPEYAFGDVAIVVKIEFEKGKSIEGVAYLEAKRIYHKEKHEQCSFDSIDWSRLEEYASSSHAHYVMLYDVDEDSEIKLICKTILTKHLLEIKRKKRDVYPYCENFHQLMCFRLFMGYGLDFDPQAVESAKGFGESNLFAKYLLTATVTHTHKPEMKLEPVMINRSVYESIVSPRLDLGSDPDPSGSIPRP
ncbi:hypothetical protein [Phytopseudomonas punonensis]|uniref:Uncharacterized protein n=1 Tax=Phytopseudomonas punonensis TaxID=1220495 RepID=A0A1M7P0J5_9GAMM|nr:hypothetical protein [Pseudomonas punonensis]SHN09889.1 hypothetical protein SAMN05216288_0571 [Pseudomonas punonensis]